MPLHPGLVPNGQQLMCPCVFARRGYISLQVLWHLVPKWAEPASPLDVLLQWEAKRSRSGVGRERRQCSSDFQPVPLPAVHQELFQCPSTRNAPELAQRWALPFFLLGLWQTLLFTYIRTYIHICQHTWFRIYRTVANHKIKTKLAGFYVTYNQYILLKGLGSEFFPNNYSTQITGQIILFFF